jgi:hypothetical protein
MDLHQKEENISLFFLYSHFGDLVFEGKSLERRRRPGAICRWIRLDLWSSAK